MNEDDPGLMALTSFFPAGALTEASIQKVEEAFLALPQVDCPVYHRFGPGIYIREVHIPAGTISIGHYQKKDHLNIMLQGRVTMLTPKGELRDVVAPTIFSAPPGRKIGLIQENMVWLNVYPTDERDVEKLEEMFLDKSPISDANSDHLFSIKTLERQPDRDDYRTFLLAHKIKEEDIWAEMAACPVDPFPDGCYSVEVKRSPIHGKGLFATAPFKTGDFIAPALINGKKTPAVRYTNHAVFPNAIMVKQANGDIELIALRDIRGMAGGNPGDEITTDYRQTLALHRRR